MIDVRYASSILDVRSIRGDNIDSEHYLVAAKVRMRLCAMEKARQAVRRKFDVENLKSQQTADKFRNRLSILLKQETLHRQDISEQWEFISQSLHAAAEEVVEYYRPRRKNWYDAECRVVAAEKYAAYKATLQPIATRATVERCQELRRAERRLFKRKKREAKRRECEEIEMMADRNARNFYQEIRQQSNGFKTGAGSCRDEDGNLVTDVQSTIEIWREQLSTLLDGVTDCAFDEGPKTMYRDEAQVPPLDQGGVRTAIRRLKNNKALGADGIPAELFNAGGEELVGRMYQLLSRIWSDEYVPEDWSLSVLCSIYKKEDSTICANYRGISLIDFRIRSCRRYRVKD